MPEPRPQRRRSPIFDRGIPISIPRWLALLGALLAAPLALPGQALAPGGGFAAIVNGEPITIHELEAAVRQRLEALAATYPPEMLEGAAEKIRPDMLRELVTERLLLQRCTREKIEIRPEEVDLSVQQKVEDLRRKDDSIRTVADFFDRWEADFGENEEQARREIADRLRISRLLDTKIYRQEYISPSEMRSYYLRHPEEFSTETTHVFRQILLMGDDPDLEAKLAAIDRDAKAGRDFGAMVAEYSQGPRASEGGRYELTDKQLDSMFSPVPETVRALAPGAVSGPLRTPTRIHIVQLVEHRIGHKQEFSECQLEIRQRLRRSREDLQRLRFESEMRRDADVRVFLK